MRIDADQIHAARSARAWSQQDLADATGLNLRTIQRIERSGVASLRSQRALAAALELDVVELSETGQHMTPCPNCRSTEVYQSTRLADTTTIGGELVPKLATGRFSSAKIRAVVCEACGLLRHFVDEAARDKLRSSPHWVRL